MGLPRASRRTSHTSHQEKEAEDLVERRGSNERAEFLPWVVGHPRRVSHDQRSQDTGSDAGAADNTDICSRKSSEETEAAEDASVHSLDERSDVRMLPGLHSHPHSGLMMSCCSSVTPQPTQRGSSEESMIPETQAKYCFARSVRGGGRLSSAQARRGSSETSQASAPGGRQRSLSPPSQPRRGSSVSARTTPLREAQAVEQGFLVQESVARGFTKPWYVLLPSSVPRQRAVQLACLLGFAVAVVVPADLGLNWEGKQPVGYLVFVFLTDAYSVLMLFVNSFTAVQTMHGYTFNPKTLMMNYVHSWLIVDLISALPLDAMTGWRRAGLLRLFRIRYMLTFSQHSGAVSATFGRSLTHKTILICTLAFLALHWSAVMWAGVSRNFKGEPVNLSGFSFDADSCDYLCLLYVAVPMLLGEPWNTQGSAEQYATATVIMLGGALFFAYLFGEVIVLLSTVNASASAYHEKMRGINDSMRIARLDTQLQARVRRFYAFQWIHGGGVSHSWANELPEALRSDIAVFKYARMVRAAPIFADFKSHVITLIAERLKPKVTMENDDICKQGYIGKQMFFIEFGVVSVKTHAGKIGHLSVGDFFGEMALLCIRQLGGVFRQAGRRRCTVTADTVCMLQELSGLALEEIAEDEPEIIPLMIQAVRTRLDEIGEDQRLVDLWKTVSTGMRARKFIHQLRQKRDRRKQEDEVAALRRSLDSTKSGGSNGSDHNPADATATSATSGTDPQGQGQGREAGAGSPPPTAEAGWRPPWKYPRRHRLRSCVKVTPQNHRHQSHEAIDKEDGTPPGSMQPGSEVDVGGRKGSCVVAEGGRRGSVGADAHSGRRGSVGADSAVPLSKIRYDAGELDDLLDSYAENAGSPPYLSRRCSGMGTGAGGGRGVEARLERIERLLLDMLGLQPQREGVDGPDIDGLAEAAAAASKEPPVPPYSKEASVSPYSKEASVPPYSREVKDAPPAYPKSGSRHARGLGDGEA